MKLTIAFLLLLITGLPCYSQTFSKSDSVAFKTPCNENCTIQQLHASLVKNAETDMEKVRAFYIWIADNIAYDVAESRSVGGNVEKQLPEKVLKSRKAVCHGYSVLFRDLCNLSDIKCHLVSGYHRQDNKFSSAGHTWNVVFVNGKWHPVDVTWAAGGVTGNRFMKEYSDKYFLQSPEDFLSEHYPLDPMWQLVPYPAKVNLFRQPSWSYRKIATQPEFNFNDTIAQWEAADSLEAELQSANRMVYFNPGDKMALQHLSYVLLNLGNREFAKGNRLIEKLYGKTKPVQKHDADEFKMQLDSIENYLLNAEKFYRKVDAQNAFDNQVVKNNISALQSNLKIVKAEKARLK